MSAEQGHVPGHPKSGDLPQTVNAPDAVPPPNGASLDVSDSGYRVVTKMTKPARGTEDPNKLIDQQRIAIYMGLAASARREEPVDVRLTGDGASSTLTVKGAPFSPVNVEPNEDGQYTINTPPGTKAVAKTQEQVDAQVADLGSWKRITAHPERWMRSDQDEFVIHPGIPVDTHVVPAQVGRPYGIVVQGEPIPESEIQRLAANMEKQVRAAELRADAEPSQQDVADREREKLEELNRSRKTGIWNTKMAVGATTDGEVEDLAFRVEVAASSAPDLRYTFQTEPGVYRSLEEAMSTEDVADSRVSTDLLSHVIPIPRGEKEVVGVPIETRPDFATNIIGAERIPPERAFAAAYVLDSADNKTVPAVEDRATLNSHELITGASRTGKTTYATRRIAEIVKSAEEAGESVGVLVITPKSGEDYYDLGEHVGGRDVVVVEVGNLDKVPVGFDPASRLPGESPKQAGTRVINDTLNAMSASGSNDPEHRRAVEQYYREGVKGYEWGGKRVQGIAEKAGLSPKLGTSKYPGGNPKEPTFDDSVNETVVVTKGHDYKFQAESMPEWVGSSLGVVGEAGEDFIKGYQIDPQKLRHGITVLNTSGVEDPMTRSLIANTMLKMVTKTLEEEQRKFGNPTHTKFVMVIEEVNETAPADSPVAEELGLLAQKAGGAGLSGMFVAQRAKAVHPAIRANTSSSVTLRLEDGDDIESATSKIGLDPEQQKYVATMPNYRGVFKNPGGRPVLVEVMPPLERTGDKPRIVGPEALLPDNGEPRYTLREKTMAEEYIRDTMPGKTTELWADLEVVVEALGADPTRTDDNFMNNNDTGPITLFKELREFAAENPRVIECAVRTQVTRAVNERQKFFLKEKSREEVIDKVTGRLMHLIEHPSPQVSQDAIDASMTQCQTPGSGLTERDQAAINARFGSIHAAAVPTPTVELLERNLRETANLAREKLAEIDENGIQVPPHVRESLEMVALSEDEIVNVTDRLTHDPSLPAELVPGPALKEFAALKAKGPLVAELDFNRRLVAARKTVGQELDALRDKVTSGQVKPTQQVIDTMADLAKQIGEYDRDLAERYTMVSYDADAGAAVEHPDHPKRKQIDALTKQHAKPGDLLFPPNHGGHTIDRRVGITVDEAVADGKRDEWKTKFNGIIDYYDLPRNTSELLKAEYAGVLDIYVDAQKAKLAAKKAAEATAAQATAPAPAAERADVTALQTQVSQLTTIVNLLTEQTKTSRGAKDRREETTGDAWDDREYL